ncbi:MAG TPA: DMT family transporter [Acetobacteraceae bacterium]|nr:DMT family transporter [Acetobacteraceae bacterium]
MSQAEQDYRRGALLVTGAALSWSTAGLLVRWTATDPWTTLFWRAVFASVALLAWLRIAAPGRMLPAFRGLGPAGLLLALCFAVSMISFINALDLTTVASVMVFQAISPLIAALLAWIWLHERLTRRTLVAIIAAFVGVLVMVSGDLGSGGFVGDAIGLAMAVTSALTIVLARFDRRVSMAAATFAGMAITAAVALPMTRFALPISDYALLALFGVGQMAFALVLFTTGVRLMPAADAGLITLLECVLAPLWVWLAFAETPQGRTLAGGVVVLGAVAASAIRRRQTAP